MEQRPTIGSEAAKVNVDGHIIARSEALHEILNLVRKIANVDVAVLILGEVGVGKQTIARDIHRQSPYAARPFVHVACGALRELGLEEKLFGQAWDGSRQGIAPRASLFESSQCSTLFLDGVSQLSLLAQVKLLDALHCSSVRNPENGGIIPSLRG